jgi:hypothetical protein
MPSEPVIDATSVRVAATSPHRVNLLRPIPGRISLPKLLSGPYSVLRVTCRFGVTGKVLSSHLDPVTAQYTWRDRVAIHLVSRVDRNLSTKLQPATSLGSDTRIIRNGNVVSRRKWGRSDAVKMGIVSIHELFPQPTARPGNVQPAALLFL